MGSFYKIRSIYLLFFPQIFFFHFDTFSSNRIESMDATEENNGCLSAADNLAHTGSAISGYPVEKLDDTTFEHRLGKEYSLVKFFTPWCDYCQRLAPTFALVGSHFDKTNDVQIAEVDCKQNKTLCRRYQIDGYPTLYLFKNGRPIEEYNGARTVKDICQYINEKTK